MKILGNSNRCHNISVFTLLTCSRHRNLQNIWIWILQIFVLIFFYWFCNKQFEALSASRFRKGCMILEQLALLLIKQKNHNRSFGKFKFEYFGSSHCVNKLKVFKLNIEKKITFAISTFIIIEEMPSAQVRSQKLKLDHCVRCCYVLCLSRSCVIKIYGLWLFSWPTSSSLAHGGLHD